MVVKVKDGLEYYSKLSGQDYGFEVFPLLVLHAKIGYLAYVQKEVRATEVERVIKVVAEIILLRLFPKPMQSKAFGIACIV